MFVDIAKIRIKAGDGGTAVSFRRKNTLGFTGPDGGDGGRAEISFSGGYQSVYPGGFPVPKKIYRQNGENGRGSRCNGKSARTW